MSPPHKGRRTPLGETAAVVAPRPFVTAEDLLDDWSEEDQALFAELLEDAQSDLQRELLHRGLAAGHDAPALHAFADAIRPLADEAVFKECTPPRSGHPLATLLVAQADPLAAFRLNGHGGGRAGKSAPPPAARLPAELFSEKTYVPGRSGEKGAFVAEADTDARRPDANDLGRSKEPPGPTAAKGKFSEDLFNAAGRPLEVKFTELAVDEGGLTLERAVPVMAEALGRGIPVPVILGNKVGDYRRYALVLQLQTSGKNRAYQLYDPVSQEVVWANEGDLLHRSELNFSDKIFRRITAVALPRLAPLPGGSRRDSAFEDQG
ncbi:MAG: hypothetical protein M3Y59_17885 [Myxococcota bacterium]|nr:hypothetical protein [Myxococcota bacterium]